MRHFITRLSAKLEVCKSTGYRTKITSLHKRLVQTLLKYFTGQSSRKSAQLLYQQILLKTYITIILVKFSTHVQYKYGSETSQISHK